MGSDDLQRGFDNQSVIFQSTLPVWGATYLDHDHVDRERLISIHAPRVGSDATQAKTAQGKAISIHAPRVGSD